MRTNLITELEEPVYFRAVEVKETLLVVLDIDGHPELGEEWSNVANSSVSASVGTSKEL